MKFTTTLTSTVLSLPLLASAWNDGFGEIASGYFSVTLISPGEHYHVYNVSGENQVSAAGTLDPCNESDFDLVDSFLPYVVGLRGSSDFCENSLSLNNDDLAVQYADLLVNVPTDPLCGRILDHYFDDWRCVIAINP